MPSPLTSSFASAAAGNTQDNQTLRREGSGGGEWSRSRTNGATQTFRRPSLATNPSHSRESAQQPPSSTSSNNTGAYIPPHMNSNYQGGSYRNGTGSDTRYSKEQLISLYKSQRESGELNKNLSELFRGGWNPSEPRNGATAAWGKREDSKEQSTGPEVCWEPEGEIHPLGLSDMTEEERELFTSSVNSPLKAPNNNMKDGTPGTAGNRKTSVSQNGPYNSSPHSTRPGPRRRETGDSITGANPLSPTGNTRFFRDDPNSSTSPATLLRRKTDIKEPSGDSKSTSKIKEESTRDTQGETSSPFDSLKRRTTGGPLSAGLNGPESPWSAGPHSTGGFSAGMGAFGSFSLAGASNPEPSDKEKRPAYGSMRGESRFKGLLAKTSSEDIQSTGIQEKASMSSLGKLQEDSGDEARTSWEGVREPQQNRGSANPYEDDGGNTGFETEARAQGHTEVAFSAFGDPIRNIVEAHQQTPSRKFVQDAMSPTVTNPYQSPDASGGNMEDEGQDMSEARRLNFGALGSLREDSSADAFGSIRGKNVSSGFDDRSQTSSTGPGRGFAAFGGLGGLPNIGGPSPWSGNPMATTGTPTKERAGFPMAFPDSMFGSLADLQSPGGLGSAPGGFGGFGRSSKMGSLFPQAMQDQMREDRSRPESAGDGFGGVKREDQHMGPAGFFGDVSGIDPSVLDSGYPFQHSSFGQPTSAPGSGAMSKVGPADVAQQTQNLSQSSGSSNSNQLPTSQQRTMVMPDRMRWIYRDPQGNVQGPWSGLEMHDWFKAGFFTAELQVKKLEDAEYEPLAQLVRRIGNSREPFLVPQIGVPHGPPPAPGNPWAGGTSVSGGVPQGGGAQPPFPNNFPSFGTTLTAEQQNALERRKQEEQYLMARQKEHLAQQQALMKQMTLTGGPHQLHHSLQHHSSAHSLQSQPSFGSITSPSAYQPSPIQGPIQPPLSMAGFHDPLRHPAPGNIGTQPARSEMDELPPFFERMNVNRGAQFPFGAGPFAGRAPESQLPQPIGNMLQDRARLQAEQQQQMKLSGDVLPGFQTNERLQEFHTLRGEDDQGVQPSQGPSSVPIGGHARTRQEESVKSESAEELPETDEHSEEHDSPEPEVLSLSKQAQDVAASQQQQQQAPPSVWQIKTEPTQAVVPPPQSVSPLPAPAAQRRHIVADTLVAESRSQTQTPVETPSTSIAPWADKTAEIPKGPSLKEIQEAEARKAAKQDEIAAAARRAQAELERQQAAMVQPPVPGLPSSSTWATATSPANAPSTGSVWAKSVSKSSTATPTTAAKKTLAQIQKEEEVRKQRAATAAAVQAASTASPVIGGKRYAELASKAIPLTHTPVAAAAQTAAAPAGAWTTVGANGKVKAPATVVASPGVVPRTPSAPVPVQPKGRPTPVRAPGSAVPSQTASQTRATDELVKWAKAQLSKGLASGINVDEFVQSLLILPSESEIISDSVYANSQTLDGRRFAEEFIRKRKLADKGVVEASSTLNGASSGDSKNASNGWNEVVKKGPEKKDDGASNAAFKVVAGKKKGRR